LTGGIGAGKSTVAALLAARGATVIDADSIVRGLQEPGTDVFHRIVERFGTDVVSADGTLDRARLADIVFRDEAARMELNAIVHPEVYRVMQEQIAALTETDSVVVLDIPLLAESGGGTGMDVIVVVEAGEDQRIARAVRERGIAEEDVRARMATQASSDQRRALADVVIVNDGSREELGAQVDELWAKLSEMRRARA
jgi:dephospho-CoA kinase